MQKALQNQSSPISSPQTSSNESPKTATSSTPGGTNDNVTIKLIRHHVPTILKSQEQKFYCESERSYHGRIFYTKLIIKSFSKNHEAFTNHLSVIAYWLYLQIEKKLEFDEGYNSCIKLGDLEFLRDFTYQQKAKSLKELRKIVLKLIEAQQQGDFKRALYHYSNFTIPTICLGSLDLLNQGSLQSYYIEGSLAVIKELYSATNDSSPIASFVIQSISHTLSALFTPTYDFDVLFEIYEVLNEFGPTIRKESDSILSMHYSKLISFFYDYIVNSSLKSKFNKNYVISYPPSMIYEVYNQFNKILPSEVFTINTMDKPVQRVFYTFYFMIGRVLDNVFPESRYLTQHRFIGPTTLYPFQRSDVYGKYLPPDLVYFANYSIRLLSFFTKRMDFFARYMKIMNPFPEKLPENRFHSRKTKKIQELQITNFRTTIIKPWNYPQVDKQKSFDSQFSTSDNEKSPSSTSSFSTNFNPLFSLNNLTDVDTMNLEFIESKPNCLNSSSYVDLFDVNVESGLLNQDFDPSIKDWREDHDMTEGPIISITKHLEDRSILMKEFTLNIGKPDN